MAPGTRAAAESGDWDIVLNEEAVPDEANLKPDVQAGVRSPRYGQERRMDAVGNLLSPDHWRYPERIVPCALLHEWYLPRHPDYPKAVLPPGYAHLPIEAYTRDDTLMPYWVNLDPSQTEDGNPVSRIARGVTKRWRWKRRAASVAASAWADTRDTVR